MMRVHRDLILLPSHHFSATLSISADLYLLALQYDTRDADFIFLRLTRH